MVEWLGWWYGLNWEAEVVEHAGMVRREGGLGMVGLAGRAVVTVLAGLADVVVQAHPVILTGWSELAVVVSLAGWNPTALAMSC